MRFLIVGINDVLLTGNLFDSFVFFKVMLTASYRLALHESGRLWVRASIHYVVINLVALFLFLLARF